MTTTFRATPILPMGQPPLPAVPVYRTPNDVSPHFWVAATGQAYPVLDVHTTGGAAGRWFQVRLADDLTGWLPAPALLLEGDGARFGLAHATHPTPADRLVALPPKPEPASTLAQRDPRRVLGAALNITGGFEGGGYAAFQTYDSGVVSYGRIQSTLASGSLWRVLMRYCDAAASDTARALRAFLPRIEARDMALRHDATLKALLLGAAREPEMQRAQDAEAEEHYWNTVQGLSVQPRGLVLPLTHAMLFDIGVHHGPRHDMLGLAEQQLGVPPRSRVGDNGISEQALIERVAVIRRDRLNRIAAQQNLPGLIPRGEFWVRLTQEGDWDLAGDAHGLVELRRGQRVPVRDARA